MSTGDRVPTETRLRPCANRDLEACRMQVVPGQPKAAEFRPAAPINLATGQVSGLKAYGGPVYQGPHRCSTELHTWAPWEHPEGASGKPRSAPGRSREAGYGPPRQPTLGAAPVGPRPGRNRPPVGPLRPVAGKTGVFRCLDTLWNDLYEGVSTAYCRHNIYFFVFPTISR